MLKIQVTKLERKEKQASFHQLNSKKLKDITKYIIWFFEI